MLLEELLHLNEHVEGSDQLRGLRVQGLGDSANAPHRDSQVVAFQDAQLHLEVTRHGV